MIQFTLNSCQFVKKVANLIESLKNNLNNKKNNNKNVKSFQLEEPIKEKHQKNKQSENYDFTKGINILSKLLIKININQKIKQFLIKHLLIIFKT